MKRHHGLSDEPVLQLGVSNSLSMITQDQGQRPPGGRQQQTPTQETDAWLVNVHGRTDPDIVSAEALLFLHSCDTQTPTPIVKARACAHSSLGEAVGPDTIASGPQRRRRVPNVTGPISLEVSPHNTRLPRGILTPGGNSGCVPTTALALVPTPGCGEPVRPPRRPRTSVVTKPFFTVEDSIRTQPAPMDIQQVCVNSPCVSTALVLVPDAAPAAGPDCGAVGGSSAVRSVDLDALMAAPPKEGAEYGALKHMQREPNTGYWKTELFFPNGPSEHPDPLDHDAVRAARTYCCHGHFKCADGDCCRKLQDLEIMDLRCRFNNGSKEASHSDSERLRDVLRASRDGNAPGGFQKVAVSCCNGGKQDVCVAAFALCAGYTGSAFKKALKCIKESPMPLAVRGPKQHAREDEALAVSITRQYISKVLCEAHEMQPVASLGSATGKQTSLVRSTWDEKFLAFKRYFEHQDAPCPAVTKSKFKELWQAEKTLVERKASTHSKCIVCANIAAAEAKLFGYSTFVTNQKRRLIEMAKREHEANHLGEREEMDWACLRAIVSPRSIWVIMVDAATQRNFELPRIKHRRSKELACLPFFGLKLMASYAPGFGFSPFLVHNSNHSGSNLMWTVVWLTIERMQKHHGYLPDELHLQVDNTCAENKNSVMLAIASWLVAIGLFKRVRVFFLMVGHTHIVIDQIFGVITKRLKAREVLDVPALFSLIDAVMAKNPKYEAKSTVLLRALFDFKGFVKDHFGAPHPNMYLTGHPTYWDEIGTWNGYHDFLFTSPGLTAEDTTVRYRQSTRDAYMEPARTIEKVPELNQFPKLAECLTWKQWSISKTKNVRDTIGRCLEHARTATDQQVVEISARWNALFEEIPDKIEDLRNDLKPVFALIPHNDPNDALCPARAVAGNGALEVEREALMEMNKQWGLRIFDRMQNPSFDLMVTSNQTLMELNGKLQNFRNLSRACSGPSSSTGSAICPGDWLLVRAVAMAAVRLCTVKKIMGATDPKSEKISFQVAMYSHSANPAHPAGLFGTFRESLVENVERKSRVAQNKETLLLERGNVVVYNCRVLGKTVKRRLSTETLRVLADALPDAQEYRVPATLPDSHKYDDQASDEEQNDEEEGRSGSSSRRAPVRRAMPTSRRPRRRVDSSEEDDSSEEEEDSSEEDEDKEEEEAAEEEEDQEEEEQGGEEEEDKQQQDKAGGSSQNRSKVDWGRVMGTGTDEEVVDEHEDMDDGQDIMIGHAIDAEEEKEETEKEKDKEEDEGKGEDEGESVDDGDDGDADGDPALTFARTLVGGDGAFAFVDCTEEEDMANQTYPCALAYLTDVVEKQIDDEVRVFGTVGWYVRHGWSTRGFPKSKPAKYTKYVLQVGSGKHKRDEWQKEVNFDISDCLIPISVPLGHTARQTVAVPELFMSKLATACVEAGCVCKS